MKTYLTIDLYTKDNIRKKIEEMNEKEGTHFNLISFAEDPEVIHVEVEFPESEKDYLFYLGREYGLTDYPEE